MKNRSRASGTGRPQPHLRENENTIRTGSRLLENMSSSPRTVISHLQPNGRSFGIGLVFEQSKSQQRRQRELFNNPNADSTDLSDREKLSAVIQERARELPIPPVLPVTPQARKGDLRCTDPLTVLTVLSKSSSHVYLRDKEPNLERFSTVARVVLFVTCPADDLRNSRLFEPIEPSDGGLS